LTATGRAVFSKDARKVIARVIWLEFKKKTSALEVQLAHFVEVTSTEMQGFGRISDMLRCINVSLTIC